MGYGRCASTYYTNDKYAIDYPLNRGDVVFSPFAKGTVVFAGRNYSHRNYGLFVVIRDPGGRYVSMSAHLNSLAAGIYKGKTVYASTVIGYAGNTGDPSIPVGEVHLHQAFYRYPSLRTDGSPYGGRGLQVIYHRYTGCPRTAARECGPYRPGGVYAFAPQRGPGVRSQGNFISN